MQHKRHMEIIVHYERCLDRYGDTHRGVDWPNEEHVNLRYRIMLDVIRDRAHLMGGRPINLLDFGCGAAHLYQYMLEQQLTGIDYSGLDLSEKFIALARRKFPGCTFYCLDILDETACLPRFDYIIMNGIFTVKRSLSFDEMLFYFQRVVKAAFPYAKQGIAFNVMSSHVDWKRDDLFHLPLDTLADFVISEFGRNFIVRNDYGLYEYTVYIYRST